VKQLSKLCVEVGDGVDGGDDGDDDGDDGDGDGGTVFRCKYLNEMRHKNMRRLRFQGQKPARRTQHRPSRSEKCFDFK
jgi:hypothetical protein